MSEEWLTETLNQLQENGWRCTPVYKNGAARPYAARQNYSDPAQYSGAVAIGVIMGDCLLLDWDGNKGEPTSLEELEARLNVDLSCPIQSNEAGNSLHYWFRWRDGFVPSRQSADGFLPFCDLKTGTQLCHIKPHKILNDIPRREELPEATPELEEMIEGYQRREDVSAGRNSTMASYVGKLIYEGTPVNEISARALEQNQTFETPLCDDEVLSVCKSITGGAVAKPSNVLPLSVKADPLSTFRSLSANVEQLEAKVKNAKPIIDSFLWRGTTNIWFAKPNGGKTLLAIWAVIEGIKSGRLKPDFVFYCNEDDNINGFIEKSKIAKQHGFHMISSMYSQNDEVRNGRDLLSILEKVADDANCHETFFIFDTLKKFTGIMSKEKTPVIFELMRKINAGGGTVLFLGHANKYESEGKPIFSGVQDIQDDVDVMYAICRHADRSDEQQRIEFVCEKDRMPVKQSISFEYIKGESKSYPDMLESVREESEEVAKALKNRREEEKTLIIHAEALGFLEAVLESGEMKQQEIIMAGDDPALNPNGVGKNAIIKAIDALDGVVLTIRRARAENNAKYVSLLCNLGIGKPTEPKE